jgi:hypothetical protein
MFNGSNLPVWTEESQDPYTTKYAPKEAYNVVKSGTFPSSPKASIFPYPTKEGNVRGHERIEREEENKKALYGPYSDRRIE